MLEFDTLMEPKNLKIRNFKFYSNHLLPFHHVHQKQRLICQINVMRYIDVGMWVECFSFDCRYSHEKSVLPLFWKLKNSLV